MRALVIILVAVAGSPARADLVDDVLARFEGEPGVAEVQRAAVAHAQVQPARVASLLARARVAALAPTLHLHVGHGTRIVHAGATTIAVSDGDSWTTDGSASWNLDRLVLNPEELRLARESQRIALRREQIVTEVTRIYFQRRRLQVELSLRPPADVVALTEERLRIDELGAILDGLTGGALSRRPSARAMPSPVRTEDGYKGEP